MIQRIINGLKRRGLRGMIARCGQKAIGFSKTQEEIDALYYFLDHTVDITALKPTNDPELRAIQIGMGKLLQVFDKECAKYNLRYWLDYGTLLGAVRHKGFIPWDDDMDVAMPREDYDRVLELMHDELAAYGINVREGGDYDYRDGLSRLGFELNSIQTGLWLDIFPMDHIHTDKTAAEITPALNVCWDKAHHRYDKSVGKKSKAAMIEEKHGIFQAVNDEGGKNIIYYHGPEFGAPDHIIVDEETVFPLTKLEFEGHAYSAPGNYDAYLKIIYGDYMKFPHNGVEQHEDPYGVHVKKRHNKFHINMEEMYQKLDRALREL